MSQPGGLRERLRQGDEALTHVPLVSREGVYWHPVTFNECHAMALGAALGLVLGTTYRVGLTRTALVAATLVAGYAVLGAPAGRSCPHDHPDYGIGVRTLRHEPWWALAAFAVATMIVA